MENKKKIAGVVLGLILLIGILYSVFKEDTPEQMPINRAFYNYISAYTDGVISKKSNIIIEFTEEVIEGKLIGSSDDRELIEFKPSIPGKLSWINKRTLEFTPENLFESGEYYTVKLKMDEIFKDIPDSLKMFSYQFRVKEQSFNVDIGAIQNLEETTLEWQRISGKLITDDFETPNNVEEVLRAELEGDDLKIKWTHDPQGRLHEFLIDSLRRINEPQTLSIEWDGDVMNSNIEGSQEFEVYALGDFRFLNAIVENGPDQYVTFSFSDPVNSKQDLNGLIRIGDYPLTYIVDGNVVRAYPKVRLIGNMNVSVERGVQNVLGHKIQKVARKSVVFIEVKPEVKLRGKGVIIPGNKNVPFLFEAVNLSAIDVRVIRIFEKSVLQFLQINDLDGSRELRRVGHVVAQKKIDLTVNPDLDLKSWNIHSLDLADIIKAEPGAIYEIAIGFRKSYSLYTCSDTSQNGDSESMLSLGSGWGQPEEEDESSFWDYWEQDEEQNQWENRDNPCKTAYFHSGRSVKRNVLASSLGITAKMGRNNHLFVAINDVNSTKPLGNIIIEAYNYQQHLIKRSVTGPSGIANFSVNEKPYLLIAKNGSERGYLRMDDARSLSISRFDVEGITYSEGLKGFIYGERGVWRPGDSIYLNFILDDRDKPIPANHPVVFELKNPSGQVVQKSVVRENLNGFYKFHTATKPEDETGTYLARVRVGGVVFTSNVKIETVVPNRLKLNIDFKLNYLSAKTIDQETELVVTWLHGAIARNLKAMVEANLVQSKTSFPKFGEYVFDDPSREFFSENKTLFDGSLDSDGKAKIKADINANEIAPGMLMANFTAKAFEPGGNFSVDRFSVPYSPFETYVGIKLPKGDKARGIILTDTNHPVSVVTLNPDGSPMNGRKVSVSLYKLDWKWWWDKSAHNVNYNGRYYNKPLKSDTVSTKNGEAIWSLRLNYPEWGRYLVRACDEGGHCTGKVIYMDWPGWAGRGQKENNAGSSMLTFTADKQNYNVGEKITLNIPTGSDGRLLLTVESSDNVLESYWVNATKGVTRFSFTATRKMAPNVYAHVSLVQPHAQTKNDRPIRMYGVIPLFVKDPGTVLKPIIDMPDELEPEQEFTIKVKEQNSKQMTYTVAVVDEGLLDLTRFRTPQPWNVFYQRQSLNIKTWDLYDYFLGAEAGKINSLLSIGGDGAFGKGDAGKKQNRFKPVVKFLGPFHLNPGETRSHTIKMPNYVGSVKTMVVAGYDGAYGHADKATPVKKPLMVLASLPRLVSPEEEITLPVTIFTMDDKLKDVKVTIQTNDLLTIEGDKAKSLKFESMGDELVSFNLKVNKLIGKATLKVTATSGKQRAVYFVDVDVVPPNSSETKLFSGEVAVNTTWSQKVEPIGIKGTNSAIIEVSSIEPLNLSARLNYLITYPHGCIEQTVSGAFPQLFLRNMMMLSEDQKNEIDKNVRGGIGRIMSFQNQEGGMSYWPGNSSANEWGTNYAGHFLIAAKRSGYNIPDNVLENWVVYQNKKARTWTDGEVNSQLTQAYRLYLLSLYGKPELSSMNRMRQNRHLSDIATWYLASAYAVAGRKDVMDELSKKLNMSQVSDGNYRNSYGSQLRNEAMLLQNLVACEYWDSAEILAKRISKTLNDSKWYSTHSTAFSLIALAQYNGLTGQGKTFDFEYRFNEGEWITVSSNKPLWQLTFNNEKMNSVEIKSLTTKIYSKVVSKGIPKAGDESSSENGIELEVVYRDDEGNELDIDEVKQGTDITAEIMVENDSDKDLADIALTYAVASGWEIHNDRLDGVGNTKFDNPTYMDQRDDRVYLYFNIKKDQKLSFAVKLNASFLGKYYLPAVKVEAMYDNSIYSQNDGEWIEVIK